MIILALDIDGVLNSWQSVHYHSNRKKKVEQYGLYDPGGFDLCPIAVSNLNCLMMEYPEMRIVISSKRRLFHTMDEIKSAFTRAGFFFTDLIIGQTEEDLKGGRGKEIEQWVTSHKDVEGYIIIDDDGFDIGPPMRDHLVKVSSFTGFDYFSLLKALSMLEGWGFKPKDQMGSCAI